MSVNLFSPSSTPALSCIENFKIISLRIYWLNNCLLCCILSTFFDVAAFFPLLYQCSDTHIPEICSNLLSASEPFLVLFLCCFVGLYLFRNSCFSFCYAFTVLAGSQFASLKSIKRGAILPNLKTF